MPNLPTARIAKFDAGMYFRFGRMRRPGVAADTCFEAILAGVRTSTTRFEADGWRQYTFWAGCVPGDLVRIWSGPWNGASFDGRSCIVEVTRAPQTVRLRSMDREAWSQSEGWAPEFIDVLLMQGKEYGLQVHFKLHTPPAVQDSQLDLAL